MAAGSAAGAAGTALLRLPVALGPALPGGSLPWTGGPGRGP